MKTKLKFDGEEHPYDVAVKAAWEEFCKDYPLVAGDKVSSVVWRKGFATGFHVALEKLNEN